MGARAGMLVVVACATLQGSAQAAATQQVSMAQEEASQRLAAPPRIAVLALDDHPQNLAAAEAVRGGFGDRALDEDETRDRLSKLAWPPGFSLGALQSRMHDADEAFAALEMERSLSLLEETIQDLRVDPDFSSEKGLLLENARLTLVDRLLGMASDKTRKSKAAEYTARALHVLTDVVRSRPHVELGSEFPPRMQRLLRDAQAIVQQEPKSVLVVDGKPRGATAMVEGRAVGTVPLRISGQFGQEKLRVWLEYQGKRSVPRTVELGEEVRPLFIDLAFEGSLWPAGAGLSPVPGTTVDAELGAKIAAFLDVDHVIIVGVVEENSQRFVSAASFPMQQKVGVQRASVAWPQDIVVAVVGEKLAAFFATHAQLSGLLTAPLHPALVAPVAGFTMAPSNDGFPWLALGLSTGLVVAGIAATVVVLNLPSSSKATPSSTTAMSVTLQSEPVTP